MADVGGDEPTSMTDVVKRRVLDEVVKDAKASIDGQYMVLVTDDSALRIITSALKMYDIVEQGVVAVENLELLRAPYPGMDALYFIKPCEESVQRLIEDFEPDARGGSRGAEPLYSAAHLYFTSRVSDTLFDRINGCAPLIERVRTFKEVNIDFRAKEASFFSLDTADAFGRLFRRDAVATGARDNCIAEMVAQLTTVFASIGEYPYIRYDASSPVMPAVAEQLERAILEFMGQHGTFHPRDPRCTLLLLDRGVDVVSPLLHECTYQSMVYDLMTPKTETRVNRRDEPETYTIDNAFAYTVTTAAGDEEKKAIVLDENDDLLSGAGPSRGTLSPPVAYCSSQW